ncbi:NAD(P)-dependent oxidoreductase [Methylobacterium sp. Leaf93]|uniref:NAD(P)-dependent oxidoreductase n=1 Tax=Methylobacterium sp. Leaf93 TaxID=1736249 RepID=UPI0006FC0406|nr:NAD(P)-dependent oxidoreductase [Methylobacterium sp. Leaf93]KQP03283.1 6-phosphogluconate dehydrogenase [Methylobacterium sp. Leaf93]
MATIAVIAPGAMGSAIAARLHGNGARILTVLAGRSAATIARAQESGMEGVEETALAEADLILSIVPPAEAANLAIRLSPLLAAAVRKPVYVDCNALNVVTKRGVAAVIGQAGAPFVDAAIIGAPPKSGERGPRFYVSGDDLSASVALREMGLDVRPVEGGVGAASALKMSYAGINKGLTALAAVMVLAAGRAGAANALYAELAESEPELLARFSRVLPDMVPKAYRWVAEMDEIASFLENDDGGRLMFDGAGRVYERLSAEGDGDEVEQLKAFAAAAEKP